MSPAIAALHQPRRIALQLDRVFGLDPAAVVALRNHLDEARREVRQARQSAAASARPALGRAHGTARH